MPEKTQVPIRVIGMPEPFPHEHETPVDPITSELAGFRDGPGEFRFRFRRQDFVGIQDENPFVPEWQVLQGPVLFLGPGAVELKLHDLRPVLLRDLGRTIGALRIDHENFTGPANRVQATRQIASFVLYRDEDRNRHFRWLVHSTEAGYPISARATATRRSSSRFKARTLTVSAVTNLFRSESKHS